jgi:hypothetical protein
MKNHIKNHKNKYITILIFSILLCFFKKDKLNCAFFNGKNILFITIPLLIAGTGSAIYFYFKNQTEKIPKHENHDSIFNSNKKENIKLIDISSILGKENKIKTDQMLSLLGKSDDIIEPSLINSQQKIESPLNKTEFFSFQEQKQSNNNQNTSIELNLSGLKKVNLDNNDFLNEINSPNSSSCNSSILEIIKELNIKKGIIFTKKNAEGEKRVYLATNN